MGFTGSTLITLVTALAGEIERIVIRAVITKFFVFTLIPASDRGRQSLRSLLDYLVRLH